MEHLTVAALREALADLPDDAVVTAAPGGRPLGAVATDPGTGRVELTFLGAGDGDRSTVNIISGEVNGAVLQTGRYHGDVRP